MYSNSTHDLALYIHIPFCKSKCIYCDFLSFAGRESHFDAYFAALFDEIEKGAAKCGGVPVRSVFIGGGTPSHAGAARIAKLMQHLRTHFGILPDAEVSIEINPGTVTAEDFKIYKEIGINRISFGLQSADNELLKMLGRIHTFEEFKDAYQSAKNAGFRNINIDLIFGIPGQTKSQFEATLELVTSFGPEHISAYSLIVEPHTKLEKMISTGEVDEPSDEEDRAMYKLCKELLLRKGYNQYELSNFAKEGKECRHNIRYWVGGEYLGFGLGAASLFNGKRFNNTDDFCEYIKGYNEICDETELSKEDLMNEFMMLGFRMLDGPSNELFCEKFGCDYTDVYADKLSMLKEKGLIEKNDLGNFALTEKGLDFGNDVFREFV